MIFGGNSAEREVSVASGAQVFRALKARGHEVLAVDTAHGLFGPAEAQALLDAKGQPLPPKQDELALVRSGTSNLTSSSDLADADVFFLALHGGIGEDGTLQALLAWRASATRGAGHAHVFAMDKDAAPRMLKASNVRTPDWLMAPATADHITERLGFPVVVQGQQQGSTIGLGVVRDADGGVAIEQAYRHDNEVI